MKKFLLTTVSAAFGALAFVGTAANAVPSEPATSYTVEAHVVSANPIQVRYELPRQSCRREEVREVPQRTSGIGAVLGAVVGGVAGNQFGGGNGRALMTGAGIIGGALAGNSVEANRSDTTTEVYRDRDCEQRVRYELRTEGYDVGYEINGIVNHVRMQDQPGASISVRVTLTPLVGGRSR